MNDDLTMRGSSFGVKLGMRLPNGYWFEFFNVVEGFIRSLTSRPHGLVEVCVN